MATPTSTSTPTATASRTPVRASAPIPAPAPVPALAIESVAKSFGRQPVLERVTLRVSAGEFVGLVGLNGAGKTTLIKGLLDFAALDAGTISIFGVDHRRTRARERLAFLPERFNPPYFLTGWDFLAHMAKLHGRRHEEEEVLETVEIELEALTSAWLSVPWFTLINSYVQPSKYDPPFDWHFES